MTGQAHTPGDVGAANLAFARSLVGALEAAGVGTAVVCPGSRSTPLAIALSEHPGIDCTFLVDERSAAFFALGHAKATGRPVALLCTSGTAGANFLPAVAEACHARVPLIVLTADRPPELRSWGAAQTMEQRTLFAGFTRWSEEAPCPSEPGAGQGYAVALARRAVAAAQGLPPGPVHLNLPFREPLLPAEPGAAAPPVATAAPPAPRDPGGLPAGVPEELRRRPQGVLVFGPDAWDPELAPAVRALADALGWPVIADPASGLRAGTTLAPALVHGADLLLRDVATATALEPAIIVRFGGPPTSAAVNAWMARHPAAAVWLVDETDAVRDPQHRAARVIRTTPRRFCELCAADAGLRGAAPPAWRERWLRAGRTARAAAMAALAADGRLLTPQLATALWSALPAGAALYAANSMVIRDLDAFAGPRDAALRLLANRGVNGIDGLLSCALGAAAAGCRPAVLWCGDVAFLHDVAGLVTGRLAGADLTVVVSNDDGGGIFEYLPVAKIAPRPLFERAFAMPHGLDLCAAARGLGWQAARTGSAAAFRDALAAGLAGGRHVIEVPVDRAANTAFHRQVYAAVGRALQGEAPA